MTLHFQTPLVCYINSTETLQNDVAGKICKKE